MAIESTLTINMSDPVQVMEHIRLQDFRIRNLTAKLQEMELLLSIEASEKYSAGHGIPTHAQLTDRVKELEEKLETMRQRTLFAAEAGKEP